MAPRTNILSLIQSKAREFLTLSDVDGDASYPISRTYAGNNYQAKDATLTALAGLATGIDKIPYSTGTDTFSQLDLKNALDQSWMLRLQDLGSSIKGFTVGMSPTMTFTTATLTSGRVYWNCIDFPMDGTMTGIKYPMATQGNFTAASAPAKNEIGIYSESGGTLTLIGQTADDASIWKAAGSTLASKALSSALTSQTRGKYWVAFTYNSTGAVTQAPVLNSLTTVQWMCNGDLSNSGKLFGTTVGTSLPATQAMSGITAASTGFPLIIY